MELKIKNTIYNIEYNIEASLCDECVEKVIDFIGKSANAEGKTAIKAVVETLGNLPGTALSMLYAGLLEHHGECGDNTIKNKSDAKALLKEYINEHKEDGQGNYYSILTMLLEQMDKDGFFDLIGLDKIVQTEKKKTPKTPQDHKTKAPKNTEK